MLFLLSLAFVLIDAFLAMLVKGWLREFDRGWRKHNVAHLRAEERERRLQELERWKLHEIVALLPILIQFSLLLFCAGLLVLILPLHLPSAILCSLAIVSVVGFYGFTTYVSIVNKYAPFSSPVSRLLARGFAFLHTLITQNAQRITSPISNNLSPLLTPGYRKGTDTPDETTQVEKGNMVPCSHSGIDPQIHVDILERLVTKTVEAEENIPIYMVLFEQPIKYLTLRPFDMEKWEAFLHTTLRVSIGQSTFSASAARTLARTMMICYSYETPNEQMFLKLKPHLGSREADHLRPRRPLDVLFASCLPYWLGYSASGDLWRTIAFLEPSDVADAELLWMVNNFHRTMRFVGNIAFGWETGFEDRLNTYLGFFAAVLTYVSSTEQSRRSKVPLTAAVIYALHAIRSAIDQGRFYSIDGPFILPWNVSTSEPVRMTFYQVGSIDADLWSAECVQFVRDLLQWDWRPYMLNDFRLSLIASLYIDCTKQAHARSTFVDLLKHISIEDVNFKFSGAFSDGSLAIYSYMALAQKPLPWDPDPLTILRVIIIGTISEYSTLQLSGLQILEIALKHVDKRAGYSSDWLKTVPYGLEMAIPGDSPRFTFIQIDYWILLHLGTLFSPRSYLPSEAVEKLEWSDTPENVHIASARLDLYDSLAKAAHEGAEVPKPDPELLRVFLWSNDHGVCTRAFNWCLDLVPTSQPGPPGEVNSAKMLETMGPEWVAHFLHVLCQSEYSRRAGSWKCLISHLHPKWAMLPFSWRHEFASAFLFTVMNPVDTPGLPAYQFLVESHAHIPLDQRQAFLPFLATLLKLVESSLTPDSIISLENWLAKLPQRLENQVARTQMEGILATKKQQLQE